MNPFEMVVIIVVVSIAGGIINNYIKSKRIDGGVHKDALDDALDRVDDLEERVKVLERVVTDDRYELKRQIDNLKD